MSDLKADQAYRRFDIPESAHSTVLQQASVNRPWTPEIVNSPGVEIEEDVYADGILQTDPREKHERHNLLIDGRLDRYRKNIEQGKNRWDIVLVEQDFYQHPDQFNMDDELHHNRNPEDELRKGDADLLFLDLDKYDIHMVEAKPHDGYAETSHVTESEDVEIDEWDFESIEELEGGESYSHSRGTKTNYSKGSEVSKKVRNLNEAWQTVVDELENDWTVYHPEFVFGTNVLDSSKLSQNPEYALPSRYDQDTGYALGSDSGFEKAQKSSDLEVLNETFFRGEITELLNGQQPRIERKSVI